MLRMVEGGQGMQHKSKVTEEQIVSRRNPEDVQEIVVWKRYSDFKKLHKDLWEIHKNIYKHTELFPPFAKAIVFGRFDETVIKERRQCAEDLLQFSANIPALYKSKQFEDFFKGGEVHDGSELIGPVEPLSDSLIDSLSDCSSEVQKDLSGLDDVTLTSQSECGGFSSDSDLISLTVDVDSLADLDDGMASNQNSPSRAFGLSLASESLGQGAIASDWEWSKPEGERESESRSLFTGSLRHKLGKQDYLEKAGELIKLALKKEEEEDYEAAFSFYRKGVDLLLEGVQGESNPTRREAVKRKTAEYLMRAEKISSLYHKSSSEDGSVSGPPGSLSSRPSWNLRSPAEELKAFRVLGVIDKVLLVMDTRTQQTFILKGLRKSSEYSRNRKTIIPRCVPNMVCLHKYIISEESVFLVLQHAEGGKLWSYISKFINRSPVESFEIPEIRSSTEIHLQLPTPSPKEISSSVDSRESNGGNMLKVIPLKSSRTPSSQDDSSNQEDGQEGSPKWMDSGSSSEEECTTSYLTLCNEYGQEKIDPGSLNEEPVLKPEGESLKNKDLGCLQAHTLVGNDNFSSQITSQELKFFTEDADSEVVNPTRISDSLSKSKHSPMEFFRIDSKDSTSELLGLDFGDKLYSLKSESLKPFFSAPDHDRSLETMESKVGFRAHDTISRGSNDSVPVISFQDAAFDDVSSVDEGRPDLLINLPGVSEKLEEAAVVRPKKTDIDILESKLLETPDVLQLNNSTEQCKALDQKLNHVVPELDHPSKESEGQYDVTQEVVRTLFTSDIDVASSEDLAQVQGLRAISSSSLNATSTEENFLFISNPLSGAKEYSSDEGTVSNQAVLLFSDQTEDFGKEKTNPALLPKAESKETVLEGKSEIALEGEKEIHQIFQDLDERLALTSRFYIPEDCIQRWAAEMVVALDALHREGIVCRDLNPNNILLNDRGHIQLTYFSRWIEVEDSCDNDAMERMYCAPEVGAILEDTEACDWWSLGAILFELLTGKTLAECHPAGINTHTSLNMPDHISEEARSLIQQLLQFNPVERLGAGVAGVEDIKSHPFFAPVDWADLLR
ncbi:ribosomal protein S6 kinase delta-1 isoform X2 [Emydura macquarii macquarii]|uniref:ribosomal protein S6 kinase delta-1 isoform X2 n=1 Tax=Emydura macquarii macquarii TaxID=1129001 RepID=UPI00352A2E2E